VSGLPSPSLRIIVHNMYNTSLSMQSFALEMTTEAENQAKKTHTGKNIKNTQIQPDT